MAKPGDEIQGANGDKLIFHQTASSTKGALLEMEVTYQPNSEPPPAHYHPNQEEHFKVMSGAMTTWINGKEQVYKPGEKYTVPVGAPHAMYNSSEEEGRIVWQVRPALNTETLFETLWGLSASDRTGSDGVPNLLQIAVLFREYNREFRLLKPPYFIQRILFSILAPIGRVAGYKTRYAEFSGPEEED